MRCQHPRCCCPHQLYPDNVTLPYIEAGWQRFWTSYSRWFGATNKGVTTYSWYITNWPVAEGAQSRLHWYRWFSISFENVICQLASQVLYTTFLSSFFEQSPTTLLIYYNDLSLRRHCPDSLLIILSRITIRKELSTHLFASFHLFFLLGLVAQLIIHG